MPVLQPNDMDFLAVVLPQLHIIKQQEDVLADYSKASRHEAAARSSLRAICLGLEAFQRNIAPVLVDFPKPGVPEQANDTAWLSVVGRRLDAVLRQTGKEELLWPPPEQGNPPAIVTDLEAMYRSAAEATRVFRTEDAPPLSVILEPIQSKACTIAKARWPTGASGTKRIVTRERARLAQAQDEEKRLRPSHARRVLDGVTILTLGITLLQAPGAVTAFWPTTKELARDVGSLVSVSAHEVLDAATTIRRELRIDPTSIRPPWVERDTGLEGPSLDGGIGF